MITITLITCVATLIQSPIFHAPSSVVKNEPILLIRCDDLGLCHSVNEACRQLIETGIPISASVIVNAPEFKEAADLLRQHPGIPVGVHLTLNAEWANVRWGPVLDPASVPTLVDSSGSFFPTRERFFLNNPNIQDIEKELDAQIQKAQDAGLHLEYLDYHMSTAVSTPQLIFLVRRLAKKHTLALSGFYNEISFHYYSDPPDQKEKRLIERIGRFEPGNVYMLIAHIGLATNEMKSFVDVNSIGVENIGIHRQAELNALRSHAFRSVIEAKGVRILTYHEMVIERGVLN